MRDHRTTDELAKVLWDYNNLNHTMRISDCILTLGSHDIRVAHRAADLCLQDFAPWIIFSGNIGRLTENLWNQPEAEIFAEETIRMGVPRDKILIENKSANTADNIRLTKELLASKGLSVETLILVQKPYMHAYMPNGAMCRMVGVPVRDSAHYITARLLPLLMT